MDQNPLSHPLRREAVRKLYLTASRFSGLFILLLQQLENLLWLLVSLGKHGLRSLSNNLRLGQLALDGPAQSADRQKDDLQLAMARLGGSTDQIFSRL